MTEFEIVVLANARQGAGRCVAGLRTDGGGWVRPVSWSPEGVLYPFQYTLSDGTEARPLDVVRIRCIKPEPKPHHPENMTLAQGQWRLVERPALPSVQEILAAHTNPDVLPGGASGAFPYSLVEQNPASASLALVRPEELRWSVTTAKDGAKQVRAVFAYGGAEHSLLLIDPAFEAKLTALDEGMHPRAAGLDPDDDVLLTLSVSGPFIPPDGGEGICCKMAAAVIVLPQDWREADTQERPITATKSVPVTVTKHVEAVEPAPLLEKPAQHGAGWTHEEDERLVALARAGGDPTRAAGELGRTREAVLLRLGALAFAGDVDVQLTYQFYRKARRSG